MVNFFFYFNLKIKVYLVCGVKMLKSWDVFQENYKLRSSGKTVDLRAQRVAFWTLEPAAPTFESID